MAIRSGSFADLAKQFVEHLPANTVLDGEIVAVDRRGKPKFNDLMFHRRPPWFFAFDLLTCEGRDWRTHQLLERKQELAVIGEYASRVSSQVRRSRRWIWNRTI
jgi:ATP-dependent DNA ligase